MNDPERPIRQQLSRHRPNRRVSGAFTSPNPSGPLEAGVAAAYRLIEDYMRRGRDEAQKQYARFWPRGPGPARPGESPFWGGPGPVCGPGSNGADAGSPGPGTSFNSWNDPYNVNNAIRAWFDMCAMWMMPFVNMAQRTWDDYPFFFGAANPVMHPRPPGPWPNDPCEPGWMPAQPERSEEWVFTPDGDTNDDGDASSGSSAVRNASENRYTPAPAPEPGGHDPAFTTEVLIQSKRLVGTLSLHRRAPKMALRMLGDSDQAPLKLKSALFSNTGTTVVLYVDVDVEGREAGVYLGAVVDADTGGSCGLLELRLARGGVEGE
jgi:hypothetical protein